jgi:tripartite-type tricarboxylate transporter receptor subunit TctC
MIHVPYKSTGTAMPELMAGQTQVMVGGLLGSRPFFTTGRLRALAVTSLQRWPSFPELPAIAETVPGYDTGTYYGMFFPKGTPQAIVTRLNTEVNKVLQEGGVKSLLDGQGMVATGGPPAALARRAKKEYDEWVKVVREAKLKIE